MLENNIKENVIEYYDNLKNYISYRNNPFFWLQYAIACLDVKEYGRAENYFDIAYMESRDREIRTNYPFDNFQINTQYARFLLEKEIYNGDSENPFSIIKKAHNLLYGNFKSVKTLYHLIIKQLPLYAEFYEHYGNQMDIKQKNQYIIFIDKMLEKVDIYINEKRNNVEKYVINNKRVLINCRKKILMSTTNIDEQTNKEIASTHQNKL